MATVIVRNVTAGEIYEKTVQEGCTGRSEVDYIINRYCSPEDRVMWEIKEGQHGSELETR